MVDLPASQAHLKAGRLKPLAVTGKRRLSVLPDVPTMEEAGIAGYESVGWFGLVAPAGTPQAIVARLNTEFVVALKDPDIRSRIEAVGGEALPTSPDAFRRVIADEIPKWARVVRAANVRLE
jgi:tripartite-type tricarboxylate transporter receptor subunit TctC